MREIHNHRVREKLSGTCDWIWSHPTFLEWSDISADPPAVDRLLCISGTHGCGKSVLASSIVQSLKSRGDCVIFFSFSGTNTSRQTLDGLVRSLLWQLLQESAVDENFHSMRSLMSHGQPLTSELWTIFNRVAISMPELLYLVIDGVDECKEPAEVLFGQVVDLLKTHKGVRAILLGRPHVLGPIVQTKYTIEISPSLIQPDIDAFINAEIRKSTNLQSSGIRDLAFKTLQDGSHGMFLWVKLMTKDLSKSSSKAEVIERLHNLPHGLQKAYCHILSQLVEELDSIDLKLARRILVFVLGARRPLRVEELQYVLALASRSDTRSSHECSLRDYISNLEDLIEKILRVCGSLIYITNGVIWLVHLSAKEFLTGLKNNWPCEDDRKIMCLQIDPDELHQSFSSVCLDYLGIGGYGFPLQNSDESSKLWGDHPLLEYASKNAIYHFNRAGTPPVILIDKAHHFLKSDAFLSWAEYFAMHLLEDGSTGVEVEEFDTLVSWLVKEGHGVKSSESVLTILQREFESRKRKFGENDQRTDHYRMFLDMVTNDSSEESTGNISNYQARSSNLLIQEASNGVSSRISRMAEILRHSGSLALPKQADLVLRLQYELRRTRILTDPLELLFRAILRNSAVIPVYALLAIGAFYDQVNRPEKALEVYCTALTKFGNREVPMKYRILNLIGCRNYDLSQYQESEEAHRQSMEGQKIILGLDHADTLNSINNLGAALGEQGKNEEAEEAYRQAIEGQQRTLGLDHADTLRSINNLKLVLQRQGKNVEAYQGSPMI